MAHSAPFDLGELFSFDCIFTGGRSGSGCSGDIANRKLEFDTNQAKVTTAFNISQSDQQFLQDIVAQGIQGNEAYFKGAMGINTNRVQGVMSNIKNTQDYGDSLRGNFVNTLTTNNQLQDAIIKDGINSGKKLNVLGDYLDAKLPDDDPV